MSGPYSGWLPYLPPCPGSDRDVRTGLSGEHSAICPACHRLVLARPAPVAVEWARLAYHLAPEVRP